MDCGLRLNNSVLEMMNIDLHRDILLQLRAGGREFTVTGYEEKDVHRAADELRRKEYIVANTRLTPGAPFEYVMPRQLTEKGEQLARAIESDWVWSQVKRWLPQPEDRVSLIAIQMVAEKVEPMRN
jgi:hypothetical protein